MQYDVIIIGGGMGGLTAGALLVRWGLRVLLLEQGERTGGYVTSFKRSGFTFDATGAFLGGCEEGEEFYTILEQTDALRHLSFLPIETSRNIYPDFTLDLNLQGGFEAYISGVKGLFPQEQRGLEQYFSLIRKIGEEINRFEGRTWWHTILFPFFFWHLIRYQRASLGAILDQYFRSAGIKQVLATLPAHLPPSRLSLLFTATLITKVLAQRVWYPRGGMGAIPQALERAFVEGGGKVRLKTVVERIEVKGGRVQGVITKEGDFFSAQRVVAAINIRRALHDLLPEAYRRRVSGVVRGLEYSLSSFLVYLGVKIDLDRRAYPYFTYISPGDAEVEYEQLRKGEMPDDPSMIITIPTLLDSSLAPGGHHIVRIMTPAPSAFRNEWGWHDRSRYRTIKDEMAQRLIRLVEVRYMPVLSERIKVIEAATPFTLERYTANEKGATYGLAPTPGQIGVGRPANKTPLRGLYLAGHYTRPAHGIVGAALSGRFVADTIMEEQRK
ncbi:MAG: NAD(P)/FAD-dependent oxidoreductase [Deltaproteobacteria bacterium]|nr:NAD(P)/FAD-dependent oxidoreductase [Deltaproteobacteria bacterium]